jgi:hypothetical protein
MAATQVGTGSLVLGDPQAEAATFIDIPDDAIIESANLDLPGDAQMETQYDSDGAFHSDIWYESRCIGATVVIVGEPFVGEVGDLQGTADDYEIMSIAEEKSKGPVRTTVTVKKMKFA